MARGGSGAGGGSMVGDEEVPGAADETGVGGGEWGSGACGGDDGSGAAGL